MPAINQTPSNKISTLMSYNMDTTSVVNFSPKKNAKGSKLTKKTTMEMNPMMPQAIWMTPRITEPLLENKLT